MNLKFETESGSAYEIRNTPWDHQEIRRVNPAAEKRADGDWVRLISMTSLLKGFPVIIEMELLSTYGVDDHGTPLKEVGPITTRTTTPVVRITKESA